MKEGIDKYEDNDTIIGRVFDDDDDTTNKDTSISR